MKYTCALCNGRGWRYGTGWPVKCSICSGSGRLSSKTLARWVGLDKRTVDRIGNGTARPSSALLFIDRLPYGVLPYC